jgi:tetratricopeptide (TPR) repeat protein
MSLEDGLYYIEPPIWHLPVRHAAGAVLLDAGSADEAEALYRQDLKRFPDNGWSLFGLQQALEAQGKTAEAAEVKNRFAEIWSEADLTLTASRF